jgi:hypothetical protein
LTLTRNKDSSYRAENNSSVTKTYHLILYRAIIAVFSKFHTNVEFLNIELDGTLCSHVSSKGLNNFMPPNFNVSLICEVVLDGIMFH